MSEEELKNKMDTFIECYKNGMIFGAPTDIEFYEKIATLQQKVEQLEKENKQLRTQVNTYENPDDLTLFYMWLDEKAKDKIKQLENIIKEAIEYVRKHSNNLIEYLDVFEIKELDNILNKGSDKE